MLNGGHSTFSPKLRNASQRVEKWGRRVGKMDVGELKKRLSVANDLAIPVNPGCSFEAVKLVAIC